MNNYFKKKILIEGGYGDGDLITKAQWAETYKRYSSFESRTVNVHDIDIDNDVFYMENITGTELTVELVKSLSVSEIFRIRHEIVDIANKMLIFEHSDITGEDERIWFHGDMKLENFMLLDNGEVKIIDPDSFKLARLNAVIDSKITTALRSLDIAYHIKTNGEP